MGNTLTRNFLEFYFRDEESFYLCIKAKSNKLLFLMKNYRGEFTPIEISRELSVTNKTVINRLTMLVKNGFVIPILVNKRIRSYELSEFTKDHEKKIIKAIS